jgi:1-acyl-sn-glycerol-3-phosphate acyltransferase
VSRLTFGAVSGPRREADKRAASGAHVAGVLPPRGSRERSALDAVVRLVDATYGEQIDRRIQALRRGENEAGFDPFGFDPETARYALSLIVFLHRTYFRSEVFGIENVPDGRCLLISNHSGMVPIDGVLIAASLVLDREPPVLPRAMVEKWTQHLPFVAMFFARVGQILGAPDNARRLLEADHPLLVFPEGVRGISKAFKQRYQLADFGPGFMRLALETKSPIVPIAVIGAEEQYPSLGSLNGVARALGMPALPLIPQLFLGMPLPLPTRYRIYFGEPLNFQGDADDEDAEIEGHVAAVRNTVQNMVLRGLGERRHVFW